MKHINLSLDAKVATIEKSKTGTFSHWIKLSTMTAGKPIWIPLQANPRFDKAGGQRKNFVQFNRSREGQLSASLIKEHEPLTYQPRTPVLALDTGLCFNSIPHIE